MMKVRSLLRKLMSSTVAVVLAAGMVITSEASNKIQTYQPVNPPVIDASGGPDAFGYRWIDNNNEPNGPTYSWVDISTSGATVTVPSTDDGLSDALPIGFSFSLYGTTYTQFKMCTNGYITLNSAETYAVYNNTALPGATAPTSNNTGTPRLIIAPFWDDLLSTNMKYQVVDGRLVASWIGSTSYSGASGTFTFQVILSPNGDIFYQYNTVGSETNSSTLGIQNADGSVGLQVTFNAEYAAANRAVRIYTANATNIVYGIVTAQTGGAPIDSVDVNVGGYPARTNAQGYYRVMTVPGMQTVRASKAGWNTHIDTINVTADSMAHNIAMRRPVAVASPTTLELTVGIGDSIFGDVTLRNDGDGPLSFTAALQQGPELVQLPITYTPTTETVVGDESPTHATVGPDDATDTPWDTLAVWNIEAAVVRQQSLGAEYLNGFVYVSSGSGTGAFQCRFYKFTPQGQVVDTILVEGGTVAWGLRDLATDGEYLYGGWNNVLRAFNPATGANVSTANITCPTTIATTRAVAYDPEEDMFYIANFGSPIWKVNRSGIIVQQWPNTLAAYGLAWYPNDADNAKVYIFSQDSSAGAQSMTRISKLNTSTGAITQVRPSIPGVYPITGQSRIAGGCFISDQMVPGLWVFGGLVQSTPDVLSICELGNAGTRRWSYSPNQGTVNGGQSSPIQIGFRSVPTDTPRVFTATLGITWGATDELINVPIEVNVQRVSAGEGNPAIADKFALLGAYPNPFNPSTSVKFSLATHSKVTMSLFDVNGREVASLLDAELPAGTHTVGMKAVDLAAGTYFIQMKAGSYTGAMKVVLLK